MSRLDHSTVYEDSSRVALRLPFIDALKAYHPHGSFTLVEDPAVTKRASLVGMFVLRPGRRAFTGPLLNSDGYPSSLYDENSDWAYNVRGLDGGGLIANANPVDAYRLALQYTCTDAVIAGSNALSVEGVVTDHNPWGYTFQAYALGEWGQLKSTDPTIAAKIEEQRVAWQKAGYISSRRKYSALVVFTWSGNQYAGQRDFLEAKVFHTPHPDGSEQEIYILTSELGAHRIRQRAHKFGLDSRLEKMLIVVPGRAANSTADSTDGSTDASTDASSPSSSGGLNSDIDLSLIPQLLYERYDMRVVNHDGGQSVLSAFCAAGALSQMNLTLCRHRTLQDVLAATPRLDEAQRAQYLAEWDSRVQYFFKNTEGGRGVPAALAPVAVLSDAADDVAVVTFACKKGLVLHHG